ncbi:MAG: hypothetical protein NUW07_10275 [Candidatus Saccharicenans sp.]|jgi:hypothetical protein|nr:hypothetical protein [Candidatus Saccharicenans sp.]MDH7494094.1 hypothetical protein [Candidatus Saccharicenans sp.]
MKKKKDEEGLIGKNKAPKCQLTDLPDIEHSTIKEKQKLIFRIKRNSLFWLVRPGLFLFLAGRMAGKN